MTISFEVLFLAESIARCLSTIPLIPWIEQWNSILLDWLLYDLCVGLDILVKMGGVNSDHANKYVPDILELFLAGAIVGTSLTPAYKLQQINSFQYWSLEEPWQPESVEKEPGRLLVWPGLADPVRHRCCLDQCRSRRRRPSRLRSCCAAACLVCNYEDQRYYNDSNK